MLFGSLIHVFFHSADGQVWPRSVVTTRTSTVARPGMYCVKSARCGTVGSGGFHGKQETTGLIKAELTWHQPLLATWLPCHQSCHLFRRNWPLHEIFSLGESA